MLPLPAPNLKFFYFNHLGLGTTVQIPDTSHQPSWIQGPTWPGATYQLGASSLSLSSKMGIHTPSHLPSALPSGGNQLPLPITHPHHFLPPCCHIRAASISLHTMRRPSLTPSPLFRTPLFQCSFLLLLKAWKPLLIPEASRAPITLMNPLSPLYPGVHCVPAPLSVDPL